MQAAAKLGPSALTVSARRATDRELRESSSPSPEGRSTTRPTSDRSLGRADRGAGPRAGLLLTREEVPHSITPIEEIDEKVVAHP
jgi:hypothetical protein